MLKIQIGGHLRTAKPVIASVTFHAEAASAPIRTARESDALGARAALHSSLRQTSRPYVDILLDFDMIFVMTVEPGLAVKVPLNRDASKIQRTRGCHPRVFGYFDSEMMGSLA